MNEYVPVCKLSHLDQVYTCEVLSDGRLLTAADDELHVWDIENAEKGYLFTN